MLLSNQPTRRRPSRRGFGATLVILALLLAPSVGHAAEVPVNLQVALFTKIFSYDYKLAKEKSGGYEILIVYAPGKLSGALELIAGFSKTGARAKPVSESDLKNKIREAHVVYVMTGVDAEAVGKLCAAHSVLSITGNPKFVEDGDVSIGLEIASGGRPKIVVNILRVSTEGHTFSSQLLRLARIIR
ncbi:MAG: YfiR family protein [Deltaproteobacteria bacterium]|nr:YfiR family protein [Deltaproteobacteria bacterium]